MSVKIQTRSINPTVFNDLLTAGTDPLMRGCVLHVMCKVRPSWTTSLLRLLPYQTLTNCEAAADCLADAIERQEKS